ALRAGQPPLLERVHDHWPQRNDALTRFRFWLAYHVIAISPLTDVKFFGFQVDVDPTQAAQFRTPQPGEYRHNQERAHSAGRRMDNALDLVWSRNIDADLQP